jgi:HEPN domain-containing protein
MAEIGKYRLVELAEAKLLDAKLLLEAGRAGIAYYVAGYAIELLLKAILSGQFKADTLPDRSLLKDVFTHDFVKLVKLCHLDDDLKARQKIDAEFLAYWEIVLQWDEGSR